MKTACIVNRLIRLVPHLAAATVIAFASNAHSATSCGPSERAGVERCVAGVSTATMMRMQQLQEASNWCWAASISMLLRRYDLDVPQRAVVQAHLGNTENVPIAVDAMQRLVDRRWTDAQGRTLVASVKPLPAWRMSLGVVAPEVLADLGEEKPVMLGAEKHAVLLVQVIYDRVAGGTGRAGEIQLVRAVVLDPRSPGGVRSLRSSERKPDMLALVHTDVQVAAMPSEVTQTVVASTHGRVME